MGTDQQHRVQFFEQIDGRWAIKQKPPEGQGAGGASSSSTTQTSATPIVPSENPIASLKDVVEKEASKKVRRYSSQDTDHSARQYNLFVDLIYRMLAFKPSERIRPEAALDHPFITERQTG